MNLKGASLHQLHFALSTETQLAQSPDYVLVTIFFLGPGFSPLKGTFSQITVLTTHIVSEKLNRI